jgi:hypothetical protein
MADVTGTDERDYVESYGIDSDAGPIFIGAGDDVIDTLGGDDWIVVTGGSDTISGGDGHDTYVAHLGTAITIDSAADAKFGGYTGSAGDVDGDGLGDLLIGGGEAAVYLVTGAALNDGDLIGADAAVDIDDDLLGQHGTVKLVAEGLVDYGLGDSGPNYTNYTALGDIDGDGKGDFLIGAPGSDGDAGTVWLVTSTFLGSYDAGSDNSIDLDEALGANAAGLYAIRDSDPAANGTGAMLGAADLIGSDGAIDLVIGSPGSATNAPFFPGVTRVIDGARLLDLANSDGVIDLANLDSADADAMVSLRGTFLFPAANALAPITDFSGDAQAELGLSAPFAQQGSADGFGRNYVITSQALEDARGTDIVIDANFADRGEGHYEFFSSGGSIGTAIAGAGDVDGDGVGDLLVSGAASNAAPGFAYLVSGAALRGQDGVVDLQDLVDQGGAWRMTGGANASDGARMVGLDLAGLGDVDGDGEDEFAVTSSGYFSDANRFDASLMMWVSKDDLESLFGSDGTLEVPERLSSALLDGDFEDISGGFIGGSSLQDPGSPPEPLGNSPASFVSAGGDIDGDGRADIVTHARFNFQDPLGAPNPSVTDIYVTIAPSASLGYQQVTQTEGIPGANPVGFYAPGLTGYAFRTIDVTIGAEGDPDQVEKGDGGTDTVQGVEAYRGSGGAGDRIDFTALGGLRSNQIDFDQAARDNAAGTFTPDDGGAVVNFGPKANPDDPDDPDNPTLGYILDNPKIYGIGELAITENGETGEIAGVDFTEMENVVFDLICFANGTRIATPRGERPVEDIRPGDRVMTRDNGPQPVRWAGRRTVGTSEQIANHRLRPVRIRAGALGPGVPVRDLRVSRQHRVWAKGRLIAAVKLMGRPGIDRDDRCVPVSYHHLLCDAHEILFANGAPAESLLPTARPLTERAPPRHALAAVAEPRPDPARSAMQEAVATPTDQ